MMKLAQQLSLMNRSDSHRHTSGFARRAIFVLSLLVFCLGSVWGQNTSSSPKIKNKTLIINGNTNPVVKPELIRNWLEVASDCGVNKQTLASKLFVRWYFETQNGEEIEVSGFGVQYGTQISNNIKGYYRIRYIDGNHLGDNKGKGDGTWYQDDITLWTGTRTDYKNMRLVCVASAKTDNYNPDPNNWQDPEIQVKYVYTLILNSDVKQFAHYQGEAYRYLKNIGEAEQAKEYDYITDGIENNTAPAWDADTYDYESNQRAVRQNVHTVHYYYYVNKNEQSRELFLPLEAYDGSGHWGEPRAYFRWYDYKTDQSSNFLSKSNERTNNLQRIGNWGLFYINEHEDRGPTHGTVGVTFNAQNAFASSDEEIQIACDVSRYLDGMDESFKTFVHEPTLSIRYLFHIMPAKTIADEIKNVESLTKVEEDIMDSQKGKPSSILEDEGRTVVSTNGGYGEFILRTKLSNLDFYHYYANGDETTTKQAKSLWWYAYYKDREGNWWRHLVPNKPYLNRNGQPTNKNRTQTYQAKYSLVQNSNWYGVGDFGGTWQKRNGNTWEATNNTPKTGGIGVGDRVHMVACVSDDNGSNVNNSYTTIPGNIMPIIWTELEFIDAMPISLDGIKAMAEKDADWVRTAKYMGDEYTHAKTLDFNDFLDMQKPQHSYENYATVPLNYTNAQYGFIYPQLTGYCATQRDNGIFGMAPLHGDYTLLKSMNMRGISMDKDANFKEEQSIEVNWVTHQDVSNADALFDFTYERKHGKTKHPYTDSNDYGTFLYVDAADEARTIATMEFNAKLCSNAKIYYTAYVASMTGYPDGNSSNPPQTAPSLRFRVSVKDGNEYVPVVTFVTGDIRQEVNYNGSTELPDKVGPFKESVWYQVYGYTVIPAEMEQYLDIANGNDFRVEIDNYCDNTDGADYCVDEISFYTDNCKIKVKQAAKIVCEQKGACLNIHMDKEQMEKANIIGNTIYWRFCDINGKPIEGDYYNNGGKLYGQKKVGFEPTSDSDYIPESELGKEGGYFKIGEKVYYSITNDFFDLPENRNYIVSLYTGNNPDEASEDGGFWGKHDELCSSYSKVFVPKAMFLSVADKDGKPNPEIEVECSDHVAKLAKFKMKLNVPDDTKENNFMQMDIPFDYFVGDMTVLQNYYISLEFDKDGEKATQKYYLEDALLHYRGKEGSGGSNTYKAYDYLAESYKTECENWQEGDDGNDIRGYYDVLKKAVDEGKLHLACSPEFTLTIDEENSTVLAFAVQESVENSQGQEFQVCSPLPMVFDVKNNLQDPSITLGFRDIDYPNDIRVVRVGKKQLDNMQQNGYLLHIPVNKFEANTKEENRNDSWLKITSAKLELLKYNSDIVADHAADDTWTNDPAVVVPVTDANEEPKSIYVATFDGDVINATDKQYISLNFRGTGIDNPNVYKGFKEGFTYRMYFQVKNGKEEENPRACEADVEFLLKVVPEYVTWNDGTKIEGEVKSGNVTGTNFNENTNWNNDKNWSRSKKEELYSGTYVNNGTSDGENGVATTPRTFAPMKFTYVTIPSGNKAPVLSQLVKRTKDNNGKNEGIYTDGSIGEDATENIQYDMMVRIEEKCEDEDHRGADRTKLTYDVEKFYGNVCKEIYFKPSAELINQQFLTYEKAWVEKELVANKWYLMSTPLKATYAGDMYVPTDKGRQETEAFQPITIAKADGTLETGYSRTKYPIYQRSWGTKDGMVYTQKTTDVYRSDYSANLGYTTLNSNMAEWGHTFNDVQVPYTTRTSFAVRAHKEDQKGADGKDVKALIRLPKEDLTYYYYQWDGNLPQNPDDRVTHSVTKGNDYARLIDVTEDKNATEPKYYVEVSLRELQSQGVDNDNCTYYLVGNPFMASLDMNEFFADGVNPDLYEVYYTYENGKAQAYGGDTKPLGIVRPLEAFFVKVKNNDATITFTADMMTDGNNTESDNGSRLFAMTAANNRGQSTANVSVGDEAKSVATLFDSNLNDVPMVYTVAGGQAVSINQVTDLNKPIAFGVTCATNDEPVDVTFSDIAQLTSGEVYVVDAANGSKQQVTEGVSYSVQPNDYGRYFLTFAGGTTGISEATGIGVVVSVRGRMVTVTSGEMLTEVRAISPDGATVYRDTSSGTTVSFTLTPGVYVVKAENAVGEQQTVKVIVK